VGAPGEILLLSTYELGHQPLALANASAFLERAGFQPVCLDLSLNRLEEAALVGARLVAISVPMHTALRLGVKVAQRIRRVNPGAHIAFFGLYASLNAEWLLQENADTVVGGEPEEALVLLAAGYRQGPGIHPALPLLRRLDYAVPSREGLPPLHRYAKAVINGQERVAAAVEASRGCRHLCGHCPIPAVYNGRFFAVPVETVMADIRRVVAAGARHITFADPDFWNGPAHADRVIAGMHGEFPDLTFDATIKIEHLLDFRSRIAGLARSGCAFVVSAVESLSDRVLGVLDKGHTRAGVFEAISLLRAEGITLRPSLLPFTPWSTLDDYLDLLDFVEDCDLLDAVDPVQMSIRLLVPPGSLLEKHPQMTPHLTELDRSALTWRWTHPDPRMDRLQVETARIAADAAIRSADSAVTFARLRQSAVEAGAAARPRQARAGVSRVAAPRLTEPWFCCAEPLEDQAAGRTDF
jgi:radical SAM superfamily enzyme YgiQ (UPF0313 family)